MKQKTPKNKTNKQIINRGVGGRKNGGIWKRLNV